MNWRPACIPNDVCDEGRREQERREGEAREAGRSEARKTTLIAEWIKSKGWEKLSH